MKTWKEDKSVELDITEVIDLLRQNFIANYEAKMEGFTVDDWALMLSNVQALEEMIEKIVTRLSN